MIEITSALVAKAHSDAARTHREKPNSEASQDATEDAAECLHHLACDDEAIQAANDAALDACWDGGDSAAAAEAHDLVASLLEAK
jgi:hypothetical protein